MTPCSSNSWKIYWMSFLQLVLSVDKTEKGLNSILPIVSLWSISQQFSLLNFFLSTWIIKDYRKLSKIQLLKIRCALFTNCQRWRLSRFRSRSRKSFSSFNSAIHKDGGFTVPDRSMISTGIIPVGQKTVHWLSMGAAGRNDDLQRSARSICIYVGSSDPVRVLRLLHTTNTLDTLWSIYYWDICTTCRYRTTCYSTGWSTLTEVHKWTDWNEQMSTILYCTVA